jgi:hypothetical protein
MSCRSLSPSTTARIEPAPGVMRPGSTVRSGGDRAKALETHIRKGLKLALSGRPTVRAHDGKAYLGLSVDSLTFQGGGERADAPARSSAPRDDFPINDDIPF